MSNINAQAFLEGYMQKVAQDPITATPLSPEQMEQLGDKGRDAYDKSMEQDNLNKFLTDARVQQHGATAGGAAIGGALGGLMGGDIASTLMGTALGGVVGWLAKYFFPGQFDKALQYAIDLNAKGKLKETINQLEATKGTGEAPSDETTDTASTEVEEQQAEDTIAKANGKEQGPEALKLQEALKTKAKIETERNKPTDPKTTVAPAATADEHMDSATVNAQNTTTGNVPGQPQLNLNPFTEEQATTSGPPPLLKRPEEQVTETPGKQMAS